MKHSAIVGGSTAKRVINCPASIKLCQQMPERASSKYADEGTLLHDVMSSILGSDTTLPESLLGKTYQAEVFTEELLQDKVLPALALVDEVDPEQTMQYEVETAVSFGDFMPGVFGSTDLIGRIGNRAVVLDWKFGSGVIVEAEENEQLMFYAAAAMRTEATKWAFDGAEKIELVIIQPPMMKQWVTDRARIQRFEHDLKAAVDLKEPFYAAGDHCRWCAGKPLCPKMNGAAERALVTKIADLDHTAINNYLKNADLLEGWITDLRALAFQMLESGSKLPDWKLVAKRGTRQWVKADEAKATLLALGLKESDVVETSLLSPAQAEKVCKKAKVAFPTEQVVSISSGSTLALVSDPRPEVLQLGKVLSKLKEIV